MIFSRAVSGPWVRSGEASLLGLEAEPPEKQQVLIRSHLDQASVLQVTRSLRLGGVRGACDLRAVILRAAHGPPRRGAWTTSLLLPELFDIR